MFGKIHEECQTVYSWAEPPVVPHHLSRRGRHTSERGLERLLARKVIVNTTPYAASYVRVAPNILNTPDNIEVGLREISALVKT